MSPSSARSPDKQKTIKKDFTLSGIGIHSGESCAATFRPAEADSGIYFIYRRGKIPALIKYVTRSDRGTTVSGIRVTEHALAAAAGLGIDNLEIELSNSELPILDGSALPYVSAFKNSGILEQNNDKIPLYLKEQIEIKGDSASIKIIPFDGFKAHFMIDFPCIGKQTFVFSDNFEAEIAPARTFGLIEELEHLKSRGLARGASLENALAIGRDGFINQPRFPDEPVRHKILDLIGDLALVGRPIKGEIFAVKSGHRLNVELARRLFDLC